MDIFDPKFKCSKKCCFCFTNDDSEANFGTFHHTDELSAHINCMLFASGLSQNGSDKEGLGGFFPDDIMCEVDRGKKLQCSYCKKKGATVGCCHKRCKKSFHFPCAIKDNVLCQFFSRYESFCKQHKPKQKMKDTLSGDSCSICFLDIGEEEVLYSPCCKSDPFHKKCIQSYALSAGSYFFKCPFCNNVKIFKEEMLIHGVHIPIRDASWELDENAYQEFSLDMQCNAPDCKCRNGREFSNRGRWEMINCNICGGQSTHKYCNDVKSKNSWMCPECEALCHATSSTVLASKDFQVNKPVTVTPICNNTEILPSSFHILNENSPRSRLVVIERTSEGQPMHHYSNVRKSCCESPAENSISAHSKCLEMENCCYPVRL